MDLRPCRTMLGILACSLLTVGGCASVPPPDVSDEASTGRPEPLRYDGDTAYADWAALDWMFPRDILTTTYLFQIRSRPDPFASYARDTRYDAMPDSLGLAAFRALPDNARRLRIKDGRRHRERALALRRVQQSWWRRIRDNPGGVSATGEPPEMTGDGVTETLRHLVNATGVNPTDAVSWYDLSYLCHLLGDTARQEAALAAGLAALEPEPHSAPEIRGPAPDDANTLRLRLLLDHAWLQRDRGHFDACLAIVADIAKLMREDPARTPAQAREALILRGLALAEAGRTGEARQIARELAPQRLPQRKKSFVRDSEAYRAVHKNSLEPVESDFARRWIRSQAFLKLGDGKQALAQFAEPDTRTEFPPHLNYRFWNDAGRVQEHFGEIEAARHSYVLAAVYRPLFVYYPLIGATGLAQVYGQAGAGRIYFLGYRHFYLCGSLFSYAANRVIAVEVEQDPLARRSYIDQALNALDACWRRGIQPASTLALRGRVHYRAGNLTQAEEDLKQATERLRALDRDDSDALLILGVMRFNREDYPGAVPVLQRYTRLRPDEGIGWRLLGLALLHAGEPDAALTVFDEALRLEPDSAPGLYNRGLLHLQQGRIDPAREDLERAGQLWPENPAIIRLRDLLDTHRPPPIVVTHDDMDLNVSEADSLRFAQSDLASPLNLVAMPTEDEDATGLDRLGLAPDDAAAVLDELRRRYEADRSAASRTAYAWCLLQADRSADVRRLLSPLWTRGIGTEELTILLRADRALGLPVRARHLVAALQRGETDPPDSGIWELVAAICLESEDVALAERALRHALELDPDNAHLARLCDDLSRR